MLARADQMACSKSVRLTPVRRRSLEILLESHKAMGAYDLLERLDAEGLGSKPVVAYRALDFLTKHGLAHRIEGLNAFVACAHPDETHTPAFLVCQACRTVAEAEIAAETGELSDVTRDLGFQVKRTVIEALGLCADCQNTAPA
ncbi:MAG: transcriptional repressor [Pseudomonadota bacterium]